MAFWNQELPEENSQRRLFGVITNTDVAFNNDDELVIEGLTIRTESLKTYRIDLTFVYAWDDVGRNDSVVVLIDEDFDEAKTRYTGKRLVNLTERLRWKE